MTTSTFMAISEMEDIQFTVDDRHPKSIDKVIVGDVPVSTYEALKAGDHKAFEKVFMLYYEKVKYFMTVLLKSSSTAEELAQTIFANLWEHRGKIDPDKNFNAYIYTVARNSVYNYIKSKNVRDKYAESNMWDVAESPDAEDIIIAKETQLLIDVAVERMPRQRKNIYELSQNQGLNKEEVAKQLDITKNAVDKQLRLAMQDIRNILSSMILFI